MKPIETVGQLFSFKEMLKQQYLELPSDIVKQFNSIARKNFFLVSRIRGEAIKIDMIPVDTEEIFGLKVYFSERITLTIIQRISQILASFEGELSMIFTTGICQEGNKCIYEVYITTTKLILEEITKKIAMIKDIIQIDIQLINVK